MIRQKFNLRCGKGHYHFSPTPDLFVGKQCFKPTPVRSSIGTPVGPKCTEPLKAL